MAHKLQSAAQNGDPNAREWMLDLREVALGIQNEQNQTSNLLQALHNFVANQLQQPAPPLYQQPPQLQQPGYQQQATSGTAAGGLLGRFTGGGFGRAIATGAGFGIGNATRSSDAPRGAQCPDNTGRSRQCGRLALDGLVPAEAREW